MANEMKIANITPKHSTIYEVGAILKDSFGYEQSNIDFYCIVEISGDWVKVMPMTKISTPEAGVLSMTSREMPAVINEKKEPIRKKLKKRDGEYMGFTFRNYSGGGWCSLWDGKAKTATHYG